VEDVDLIVVDKNQDKLNENYVEEGKKVAKCPKCKLKLSRNSTQRRRKTRIFSKYECPQCGSI
jgi:transposase-like protein